MSRSSPEQQTSPVSSAPTGRWSLAAGLSRLSESALAWDVLLGLLTFAWVWYFTRSFFPGRMNVDIADQYAQATGRIPVTDWHPPVMSAVWRVLMDLTGQQGSLFVLQVGMFALAGWLLGVLIHRVGASRWMSLLGPALLVTPWTVSQLTTLWKDTQMAAAMVLAVVLIVFVRLRPKTWALCLPALLLLVYALGIRKNAIFAIVPIAVYLGYCLCRRVSETSMGRGPRLRSAATPVLGTIGFSVLVLVVLAGGVKATDLAISSRVEVEKTGQISQIFLDDVMFSVPEDQLLAADAPPELKDHINSARDSCLEQGEIWDAYWNCYGRGESGEAFSPIAYQDELKDLWLNEVITDPARYLEYRAAVFSHFFFSSRLEYWPVEWNGEAEKVGFASGSPHADHLFRPYVEDFALGTFPMLFKPWFWSLIAVVLLGMGVRAWRRNLAGSTLWPEVIMLTTSALCYVFGYLPIAPANHFRYTYWPAVAVTLAFLLVMTMWRIGAPPTRAFRESKTGHTRLVQRND